MLTVALERPEWGMRMKELMDDWHMASYNASREELEQFKNDLCEFVTTLMPAERLNDEQRFESD